MTTQLQSPAQWPFPTPVVPPTVTTSGQGYVVDENGQIAVEDQDVPGLIALGFSTSTTKVVSDTAYTFSPADNNSTLSFTATSNIIVTVPDGLWAPGFRVTIIQNGLISGGNLNFAPGDDNVTILNLHDSSGTPTLQGQYSVGILIANPVGVGQWILTGDVS